MFELCACRNAVRAYDPVYATCASYTTYDTKESYYDNSASRLSIEL